MRGTVVTSACMITLRCKVPRFARDDNGGAPASHHYSDKLSVLPWPVSNAVWTLVKIFLS